MSGKNTNAIRFFGKGIGPMNGWTIRRTTSRSLSRVLSIYCAFFALTLASQAPAADGKWSGVDETVVEKFAEAAGRPSRDPFINTDQGDLLLFVFLLAGTIGGFIAGYYFRTLFPPGVKEQKEPSNV